MVNVAPGFAPFREVEFCFNFGEGNPGDAGDFRLLFMKSGRGRVELGEEEDDFFFDVEAGNVVVEAVASGGIEDDREAGFFLDFAEGGFELGFAGFDVALRKAGEAVLLRDEEDCTIFYNDGAARFFVPGARMGMFRVDGLGVGKIRYVRIVCDGGGVVHRYIILCKSMVL